MLLLRELKVEIVEPQRDHELQHYLCKGLSEADADPAKERTECEGCPLAPVRLLVPLAAWVEPVRYERHRIAPLLRVTLEMRNINDKCVVFAHLGTSDGDVPRHLRDLADGCSRVEAQ